jgi:PilZ domain
MVLHHVKHLLSETLALGAFICPVAMAMAALVGLASWMIGGQEHGLLASWITWCVTMGAVPIFLRLSCGPDTSVICDRCLSASRRHPWRQPAVPQERRRHARYRVDFPATFSNERTSGFGMIADVSAGGCRVESNLPIAPGDVGQLLIELPDCTAPLKVSQALVRWVREQEYGLEFIRMEPDDEGWLNRLIGHISVGEEVGQAQ